jgi:Fe-S-cluster-containing dehydrogenase component
MCYDRTSAGKKPMCASVCPSQALFFGTREEVCELRPLSRPLNRFQFGDQTINTKVHMLVPINDRIRTLDVTAQFEPQSDDDMMMAGLYDEEPVCL